MKQRTYPKKAFCKECKKEFWQQNPCHLFCCDACRERFHHPPLPPKSCAFCGREFPPRSKRNIFCSDECYRRNKESKKKRAFTPIFCLQCGGKFTPKNTTQKFCCARCGDIWRSGHKHKLPEKAVCPTCGKKFAPRNGNHKYCSRSCQPSTAKTKAKEPRPDGKNRPFTEDTVYLINKWHREGMSVDNLAKMLDRSRESVLKALKEGGVRV